MRGRSDSSFAALQSARSRGVSSNRQRRLTTDAQSRAGDQASAPQMYRARSPLKISTIPFLHLRSNGRIRQALRQPTPKRTSRMVLGRSVAKEQRMHTSPRTLLTQIHQANVLQRAHEASRALFHSGSTARLTSRPAFPSEKSDLLHAPSNFLHPSTRPHQPRPARSGQQTETPAILFA